MIDGTIFDASGSASTGKWACGTEIRTGGVPVGTLGAGGGGPVNAALLAARILALSDESLARRVNDHRSAQASNVRAKDARLQDKLGGAG